MNRRPPLRSRRGIALLAVLGCLVFLLGLILAFLASTSTDLVSSKGDESLASTRFLADSCSNLVMAQIRDATSQGSAVDWASQPGMIRCYNNTDGTLVQAYKLYSSDSMVSASFNASTEAAGLSQWAASPALFTDLNAPVTVSGATHYPIFDPGAVNNVTGASIAGTAPAGAHDAAPMPVRWIYVLKDGTLSNATGTGNMAKVAGAGAANPVMGRIAFWTDDETCKLNINTAAGDEWSNTTDSGAFWDTPRVVSLRDGARVANGGAGNSFAYHQPATGEYQRYPGHPATVYLSSIFPTLTRAQLFGLVPRINSGGSQGGTALVTSALGAKTNRLYATVDELYYTPTLSGTDRQVNLAGLTPTTLDQARFFLTANNRAPEVNLFDRPRVAIWPVPFAATARTTLDKLLAFCSTIGKAPKGFPYYFQRQDSTSTTTDWSSIQRNQDLYTYLQNLTSTVVPGFGGNFKDKFGSLNRDQLLTEMVDYVRCTNLNDTSSGAIPFAPTGQVTPLVIAKNGQTTKGFGRFPTIAEAGFIFAGIGEGPNPALPAAYAAAGIPVDPRQIAKNASGAAAYAPATPPAGQTAVQGIFVLHFFNPAQGWSGYTANYTVEVSGLNAMAANGASLLFPQDDSVYIDQYGAGNTSNTNQLPYMEAYGGALDFRAMLWCKNSHGKAFSYKANNPSGGANSDLRFPFFSKIFNAATGGNFTFTGGSVTVKIYSGDSVGANLVQTLTLTIPGGTFAVPALAAAHARLWGMGTAESAVASEGDIGTSTAYHDRFGLMTNKGTWDVLASQFCDFVALSRTGISNDTVQTMVPTTGDHRLTAAISNGPAPFSQNPAWGTTPQAHCFITTAGYTMCGSTHGILAKGAAYLANKYPAVPTTVPNGAFLSGTTPGDWDTGFSEEPDGAFINKADEGNTFGLPAESPYYNTANYASTSAQGSFSANRQVPSPGMFGSLPPYAVGPTAKPWCTLLFRPGPAGHPGLLSPPDHLLMDLFWMPVVEPYAISEPFSTAGKVNMNYQIVPFTWINRDTAVRSVLRGERMLTLQASQAATYKLEPNAGTSIADFRCLLDLNETLKGFQQRFDANDIFHSPTEICGLWLIPTGLGLSYSGAAGFWAGQNLTGDNVLERPYTNIYAHLTTRSNTYTVHLRVQTLKQAGGPNANPAQWNEGTDSILGEYRGSVLLERYIDPNQTNLPDFATLAVTDPKGNLGPYYKFRVLTTKQFNP